MDTNSLILFYHVVRFGSFAEAARHLNTPVSTMSRKIQLLEDDLGARLLNRTTRSLQLTENGEAIWQKAEQMFLLSEDIVDIVHSQSKTPTGSIKMTAPQSFVNSPLADWLIEFKHQYPQITIELSVSNRLINLAEERVDFGFRQGPLNDSNLVAIKLVDLAYGLFAAPEFLAQHPSITALEDLQNVSAISVNSQGYQLPWILKENKQTRPFKPNPAFSVEDNDLNVKATIQGLGVGYLPTYKIKREWEDGKLKPVLEQYWPDKVGFYMVYQSKRYLPEKDRIFIDFIKHNFQQLDF